MSPMASIIAAATAFANAGKQITPGGYLNGLNYQMNPQASQGHVQNAFSPFQSEQMAAIAAAAFKYNSIYNSNSSSMTQNNYLAKYMSVYYNKPIELIQRMIGEQAEAGASMLSQGANLSNLHHIQKLASLRYNHSLAKNGSGFEASSFLFSPKIVHKNSRSPSPSGSCASIGKERSSPIEPVQSPNIDINSSSSTSSSISPENRN